MRNFILMMRAMRIVVVSAVMIAALTLATRSAYCDESLSTMLHGDQNNAQSNVANIKKIYVPELVRMIHDKTPGLMIFDANGEGTRAKFGVIPGSRLLSSADEYDVATELPANKNDVLVFYCADRH